MLPWASPSTWISMWRGSSTNFSMNTRSSPNALFASFLQDGEALAALNVVVRDAQALAAAAGRGLDHHRIADALGDRDGLVGRADRAVVAGDRADLGRQRELLRRDLVAHRLDRVGLRADEDDAFLLERSAERRVLRQEAVARVHGLGAGVLARLDDALDHEIALRGRAADRSAPPRRPSRRGARPCRPPSRRRPS